MVRVRIRMPYLVHMYLGGGVQADRCVARVATRGVGCGGWSNYGGALIGEKTTKELKVEQCT